MDNDNVEESNHLNESQDSHTAADFINSQLQLEADAREALPYKFDSCTYELGPLRQLLFACLTCNPPPTNSSTSYTPAAVCYSCSVSCHGEHTLVELFNKRNFVCDCGTTRIPNTTPCTLRINPTTNTKGNVTGDKPDDRNRYNQNFQNKFCGCACDYDADTQKGTMFQCLGLGSIEDGGCGEDWWHPACIMGVEEDNTNLKTEQESKSFLSSVAEVAPAVIDEKEENSDKPEGGLLDTLQSVASAVVSNKAENDNSIDAFQQNPSDEAPPSPDDDNDPPLPPGFPSEDSFDSFICYKCVSANPWIKRYAGTSGFLPAVFHRSAAPSPETNSRSTPPLNEQPLSSIVASHPAPTKRKASSSPARETTPPPTKRVKNSPLPTPECKYTSLPSPPTSPLSLFLTNSFRSSLCHCPAHFPLLTPHPALLDTEETYEPPLSEPSSPGSTSSLYDRGASALNNVDRVRAIEGVMAYNQLKEKLTPWLREFAESGKAIGADDVKAYFAKLREGNGEGGQ